MNNQVLITGASGLLGFQLVSTFKSKNYEVIALFNQTSGLADSEIKKVHCDISDKNEVLALKRHIKSNALIVHCAAITDVDLCEKEKKLCLAVNAEGTKNMCELASRNDSTLIYISTSSVFNGKTGNYKETDKTSPLNYYSLSKVKGENHILGYKKGIVIRTIPLGLHFENRKPTSFLEWLVYSFKNDLSVNLFTDVKINPLSVSTLAEAMVKIPTVIRNGFIHLGSLDVISKADIGREVIRFFPEYSGKINFFSIDKSKQITADRPKEMWLNVEKALSLGFKLPKALSDIRQYLTGKV